MGVPGELCFNCPARLEKAQNYVATFGRGTSGGTSSPFYHRHYKLTELRRSTQIVMTHTWDLPYGLSPDFDSKSHGVH